MYKVTKYPQGTFCWADCGSTKPEDAKNFYMELMGWDAEDIPIGDGMVYTMFKLNGENVAALSGLSPEQGTHSAWTNYIAVDDVDAMVEKVKAHGGTVMGEPMDVFENGRMLLVQDPTGAWVAFWQAKSHIGATWVNDKGAMAWNELHTKDVEKAKAFYSGVFGWVFETDDTGYTTFKNNGRFAGGIVDISGEDRPVVWIPYFNVADIEQIAEKAEASGGKMLMPIIDMDGIGRFSMIADPSGAPVTYMQMSAVEPWEDPK